MTEAQRIRRNEIARKSYYKNRAKRLQQMALYREENRKQTRQRALAYYYSNPQAAKLKQKQFKERNKDYFKNNSLLRNFGITLLEYNQLLKKQQNVCKICNKPETALFVSRQVKKTKDLCVDHDHVTGKVRGLLCQACNTALGLFKEDFEALISAAKYLQDHKGII